MPISTQEECARYGSEFLPPESSEKLGIALGSLHALPLNALRHPPEGGTCGWYIWGGGEMPQDRDFFQPLHVSHIEEYCPNLLPFLALAPGWRVLLAPEQTDVWFDENLLNI
jgi:hypothetical protein